MKRVIGLSSNSEELKVSTVREDEDVQIYKVEGEGIEVTFTNSTKTGRLYIDGAGSRKFREKIVDAVIKHTENVKIGRPSRVSLPIMVTMKTNNENKLIKTEEYIQMKQKEFTDRGSSIKEKEIRKQISYVLNKQDDELTKVGLSIKNDIIVE